MSKIVFKNYNNYYFINRVNNEYNNYNIENFFKLSLDFNLDVYILPRDKFNKIVLEKSDSYKNIVPSWLEGLTTEKEIFMVEPELENIEKYVKLLIHELVHLTLYKISLEKREKIMEEGLAYYISNQITNNKLRKFIDDCKTTGIKSIHFFLNINSSNFVKNNGYFYGYYLIKFLSENYGNNKIYEYLINREAFLKDITKIDVEFHEYIKKVLYN